MTARTRPVGSRAMGTAPQSAGVAASALAADDLAGILDTLTATGSGLHEVLAVLDRELGLGPVPALEAALVRMGEGWTPGGQRKGAWPGLAGHLGTLFKLCLDPLRQGALGPAPILAALARHGIHPVSLPLAGTGKVGIARMVELLGLADDPLGKRVCGQFAASGAELRITGLTDLADLPRGLQVQGNLMMGQTPYRNLPEGLRVRGLLHAPACPSLETLPASLGVVGSINLRGCPSLKALPEGLRVVNDLTLAHSALVSLPAKLEVGGILDLRGCAAWDRILPADTRLEADPQLVNTAYRGRIRTDLFNSKDGVSAADYRRWMRDVGLAGRR